MEGIRDQEVPGTRRISVPEGPTFVPTLYRRTRQHTGTSSPFTETHPLIVGVMSSTSHKSEHTRLSSYTEGRSVHGCEKPLNVYTGEGTLCRHTV